MKTIKNILFLVIALSMVACSDFTDGINDSPNSFQSSPAALLIGQVNLEVVKLSSSQASRASGIFTDQFTGFDRQYVSLNNYLVTAGDYDDDWDDIYVGGFAQAKLAEEKAAADGNTLLVGVAQILQGYLIAEAATLWGDVPYTQAGDYLKYPNPTYEGQKAVLTAAQGLLSSGIAKVGTATVGANYGAPVFVNNSATWAQVANSLKARYYLVAKDYPNALAFAKLGIPSAANNLLSSHNTNTGARNMYYQFLVDQRSGYLTVTGSNLYKYVTGAKARLLTTPGDATKRAPFYFSGTNLRTSSGGVFAADASFPIITYTETKLIEAEAEYRAGTAANALIALNAVRAQLRTQYAGTTADFPDSAASGNTLLLQILEEKYISLIGSTQVFHDIRRTDNAIGVPIKGTGTTVIPQRFLYPQSEINSNKNFPGIVSLFTKTPVNN